MNKDIIDHYRKMLIETPRSIMGEDRKVRHIYLEYCPRYRGEPYEFEGVNHCDECLKEKNI